MTSYTDILHDSFSVVAIYNRSHNEVTPWKIKWDGEIYMITEVFFHQIKQLGKHIQHIFSVTDGNLSFQLSCDLDTQEWTLEGISDGTTN